MFLIILKHCLCKSKQVNTYEKQIDVSSNAWAVLQNLLHPSQKHTQDRLLYVLVTMNTGGQGASQLMKQILQE